MAVVINPVVDETNNVLSVPISGSANPADYRVLYAVPSPTLTPEDVVFITTQFEVTSQGSRFPQHTQLFRFIVRGTNPTDVSSVLVTQPVGDDLLNSQYSAGFVMDAVDNQMPSGQYYYNVVVYAVNPNAVGQTLELPQYYGDCSLIVMDRP